MNSSDFVRHLAQRTLRNFLAILLFIALPLALPPTPARAAGATFTVNSLADSNIRDGKCTLREAIISATPPAVGTLDCGLGTSDVDTILFSVTGTIVLGSALPAISDALSIDGGNSITVSGGNGFRIFTVQTSGTLTLNNITLIKGFVSGQSGGAISNHGTLTLNHVKFLDNQTDTAGLGGAIDTEGNLTITNSEFANNKATYGGAIFVRGNSTLTVNNSTTFSGNWAGSDGGGIYNEGTVNLTNVSLSGNSARSGGGIQNFGTATLTNVSLSGNSARSGGGIDNQGTATLTNVSLSGNSATDPDTGRGGGISNEGTVNLTNSTLSGNTADFLGGAIANSAPLTLTHVTLSNNTSLNGGGIYNSDGANLTNVTLSNNSARRGGGIFNDYATANLTNVTLSNNSADPDFGGVGGGIYNGGSSSHLNLKNVIVANSPTGGNCQFDKAPDSSLFNLSSDNTCGFGPGHDGLKLLLGPLANNGGPTKTFALKPGSPAINNGTGNGCPSNDQRGGIRPQQTLCDIGAFEHGGLKPGKPKLISAIDVGDGREQLKWKWTRDAFKYKVVVKNSAGNVVAQKTTQKTSVAFTLGPGTFTWTVTAINALGRNRSNIGSFTR